MACWLFLTLNLNANQERVCITINIHNGVEIKPGSGAMLQFFFSQLDGMIVHFTEYIRM